MIWINCAISDTKMFKAPWWWQPGSFKKMKGGQCGWTLGSTCDGGRDVTEIPNPELVKLWVVLYVNDWYQNTKCI